MQNCKDTNSQSAISYTHALSVMSSEKFYSIAIWEVIWGATEVGFGREMVSRIMINDFSVHSLSLMAKAAWI